MSKLGFVAAVLVVMIHADVQDGCPESVRMVKDLVVGGEAGQGVLVRVGKDKAHAALL